MSDSEHLTRKTGYYPINVSIAGRSVLVCGGGKPAMAECRRLLEFGAHVDVVAPNVMSEIQELAVTYGEKIRIMRRHFSDEDRAKIDTHHYFLVFAYNNREHENSEILKAAAQANVLSCGIDQFSPSHFIVPWTVRRGHLKIAVSTDGISPPLEVAVMQRIEAGFVSEIDKYMLFLDGMLERINRISDDARLSKTAVFRRIVRRMAESEEILSALQRRNFEEANHIAEAIVFEVASELNEPARI